MTTLPPCADCGHTDPHPAASGCLHREETARRTTWCPCPVYVPPAPTVVSSPTITQARTERDAAVAQVEDAADGAWLIQAGDAIRHLATIGVPFSTDDVWDRLYALAVPAPREPRALGPVVKRALTAGIIQPDGTTQSRRRHAALIRTYVGAR